MGVEPPFVEVAVNDTKVPEHKEMKLDDMVTVGETEVPIAMVIALLITLVEVAQVALLVSLQTIISLLLKMDEVKTGEFVPTFNPLTCH